MISWYLRRFRPVRRHAITIFTPRLESIEDRVTPTANFTAGTPFTSSPVNPNGLSWNLVVGDFNADGKQDFVSSGGFGNNNLTPYLGNGDGTWTQKANIAVAAGVQTDSVVVADLVGKTVGSAPDGLDDIAYLTTSNTARAVVVLASQGTGAFTPVSSTAVPFTYISMAAGDLTSDGIADLVCGRFGSGGPSGTAGEYAVLTNSTASTFTISERSQTNGLNWIAAQPIITDIDGDGKNDLVANNLFSVTGTGLGGVYYGKGDGSFDRGSALQIPVDTQVDDVVVGDFNADGRKDVALVVNNTGTSDVHVFLQQSAGTFTLNPSSTFSTADSQIDVIAADFDFDGDAEIITVPFDVNDATIRVHEAGPGGVFTTGAGTPFATAGFNTPVAVIDGDFNGTPDLIVGTFTAPASTAKLQYLDNNNSPSGVQTTSMSVSISPNPAAFGSPMTFTAKVAQFGATPTGNVTFTVDGVDVGTATIGVGGVATLVVPGPFALGVRTLTASYPGDANYSALAAPPRTFTVTAVPAAVTVTIGDQNILVNNLYGELVLLSGQVTKVGSFTPTGSFEFFAQGLSLGVVPVDAMGLAQLFTSTIPVGTNTITAVYSGDSIYAPGTGTAGPLQVVQMPTLTQVVTSANPAVFGQPLTYTINLFKNTASKVVTDVQFAGQVVLFDNDNVIAILNVDSKGEAVFNAPLGYALGDHTIFATFAGNANLGLSSSTPFVQVIDKANTSIVLTATAGPITFGESVDLKANVSVLAPGLGDVEASDVEFYQDGVLIATVPVNQGEALFTVADLPAGTFAFTAKFLGNDSTTASASSTLSIDVLPTTSTTTLILNPNPATLGQTVVVTASVVNANGIPVNTGNVIFSVNYNGSALGPFGGSPVFNGKATLALDASTISIFGSGDVSAQFIGDTSILDSTDGPIAFTVNKAVPFALLASDGTISAPFGTDVPFSVALSPPSTITIPITGTVEFYDDGVLFDTVTVTNNLASTSRRLSLGVHTITAKYSGDASYVAVEAIPFNYGIFRESDRVSIGAGPGGPDRVSVYAVSSSFDTNGNEILTTSKVFSPLFAFSPDHTAGVRVATADFNGDGVQDIAMGTGPGTGSRVKILNGKDGSPIADFSPFGEKFTGGVYVSAGDVNNDLQPDLVVTPDERGGARVRVYNGATFSTTVEPTTMADFFGIIDGNGKPDTAFRGGARASIGDINGDGFGDIVMAAGFGGGPRVATFNGKNLSQGVTPPKLFGDFLAFDPKLRNGSFVAVGDVNGDGKADIVAGAGPGGGPLVNIFSGDALLNNKTALVSSFFAGDTNSRGGVPVALRYIDSDNLSDLVVGTGPGDDRVAAYLGKNIFAVNSTPPVTFQIDAFTNNTPDPDDQFRGTFVG